MRLLSILLLSTMTGLLYADIASDFALFSTHLTVLEKRLSEQPTKNPIPKSEYDQWPRGADGMLGTRIKHALRWQDFHKEFLLTQPADYTVPIGTEIMPAGYLEHTVTIGEKSYFLWKQSGFFAPFYAIEKEDYKDFEPGVIMVIARLGGDISLKIKPDGTIDNIDTYIDEDDRLLCVKKLDWPGTTTQDLTKVSYAPVLKSGQREQVFRKLLDRFKA